MLRQIGYAVTAAGLMAASLAHANQNQLELQQNPELRIAIEGHCDSIGTAEYNLALGERRAKASMNYLVSHVIAATRITVMSYGEERGMCRDHGEHCWSKNRRAHFLVKAR